MTAPPVLPRRPGRHVGHRASGTVPTLCAKWPPSTNKSPHSAAPGGGRAVGPGRRTRRLQPQHLHEDKHCRKLVAAFWRQALLRAKAQIADTAFVTEPVHRHTARRARGAPCQLERLPCGERDLTPGLAAGMLARMGGGCAERGTTGRVKAVVAAIIVAGLCLSTGNAVARRTQLRRRPRPSPAPWPWRRIVWPRTSPPSTPPGQPRMSLARTAPRATVSSCFTSRTAPG